MGRRHMLVCRDLDGSGPPIFLILTSGPSNFLPSGQAGRERDQDLGGWGGQQGVHLGEQGADDMGGPGHSVGLVGMAMLWRAGQVTGSLGAPQDSTRDPGGFMLLKNPCSGR